MDIPQERKVVTEIPGPASKELLARRETAVPRGVFNTTPIFTQRASGAIIEDVDGNRLIDLSTGIAVLNVGNTSPAVVKAVQEQAERYTHTCFHVTMNEPYVELAEKLNAIIPGDHEKKTMFANSGAEAVENAVKIARYHTGRQGVVVFDHAFHGRTLLAMTMTGKAMPYRRGFGPFAGEVYRVPYAYPYRCPAGAPPDACGPACAAAAIDRIETQIGPSSVACMVIEPVIGEGGFIVPAPGFIPTLKEYCDRNGILFVTDEVQTGFGRTGRWFGIEHEGVVPDLVITGKALGGGLPVSGVTGRAEVMEQVHVGGIGGTFGGNPIACAAGLAVIELIERDGLCERAGHIGRIMLERLREIAESSELVGDVRGRGAMAAIELVADRATKVPAKEAAERVIEACYRDGVIVLKAGTYDNVIRLLPPLTITEDLLDDGLSVLAKAVALASS